MKTVQHISFPRSGHHMLVHCIREAVPDELRYCEYYDHCETTPCTNPQTNYQKNHDFLGVVPPSDDFKYIVQYRNPLESIVSWYDLYREQMPRSMKLYRYDTARAWNKWLDQKTGQWQTFVQKWILEDPADSVLFLSYHQFLRSPESELFKAVKFAFESTKITPEIAKQVVEKRKVAARRNVRRFRHFDEARFRAVEAQLQPEMDALGLESVLG